MTGSAVRCDDARKYRVLTQSIQVSTANLLVQKEALLDNIHCTHVDYYYSHWKYNKQTHISCTILWSKTLCVTHGLAYRGPTSRLQLMVRHIYTYR